MTAKEVEAKLARKYSPPYYAFFPQFRDATGWEGRRTADAVALGLYASRGYSLDGFEIKVNRSDWLAELKQPQKSEAVGVYCDHWWIVAPAGVIAPGEVPHAWGWLEATGRGIKGIKDAPVLKPVAMERHLLASLVQRALGGRRDGDVIGLEEHEKILAKEFSRGTKHAADTVARAERELASFKRQVDKFEKASGVTISQYGDGEELGQLVALIRKMDPGWTIDEAARVAERLRNMAEEMDKNIEEIKTKAVKHAG